MKDPRKWETKNEHPNERKIDENFEGEQGEKTIRSLQSRWGFYGNGNPNVKTKIKSEKWFRI